MNAPFTLASVAQTPAADLQDVSRVAVLVLAMHRTGSSATTRFLNFLGCALPNTLLGANPTNVAGHWESDAIRIFNDQLLAEAGSSWSDWLPMHSQWANSQTYRHNLRAAGEVLDNEFADAPLFVLKDPRICRFAGFWYEVLEARGIKAATLIPLRNPLEVAASLSKRDGMDPTIAQLLWLRHMLDAEFASRGHRRTFARYEDLLNEWSSLADRVGEGLDIVWPRSKAAFAADAAAFLSHDLRHHVQRPADLLENAAHSRWLRDTYAILLRWASQGENENDREKLDAIRLAFNEAGENFIPQVTGLARTTREIGEINEDRHRLAQQIADLTTAMAVAQADKADAASELDAAHCRTADLEAQLGGLAAQIDCLNAEQAALHLNLEEAVRHWQLLEQKLEVVEQQREQAESARDAAQSVLNEAMQTIATMETELVALRAELVQTTAVHLQVEEQFAHSSGRIETMEAELEHTHSQLVEANFRIERLGIRSAEADAEALRWKTTAEQREAEQQADRAEMARLQEILAKRSVEIEEQTQLLRVRAEEMSMLQHELDLSTTRAIEMSKAKVELTTELDILANRVQTSEAHAIALTAQLHDARARAEEETEKSEFLRATLQVFVGPDSWWQHLIPAAWARTLKNRVLRRKGLFDPDGYRDRYTDIAQSERDPLFHYVAHGLDEGRKRI